MAVSGLSPVKTQMPIPINEQNQQNDHRFFFQRDVRL